MSKLSIKKNEISKGYHPLANQFSTQNTTYCVCAKCREKIPYISRRCFAVEDKNGNVKFLGKSFTLTNLCMGCLKESCGHPKFKDFADEKINQTTDFA